MATETWVWIGRFHPVHIGHVRTLEGILEEGAPHLALMIIDSRSDDGAKTESGILASQHARERNPFTVWERVMMWRIVLRERRIANRVEVLGIPRTDISLARVETYLPAKRDRVICLTARDDVDKEKARIWAVREDRVRMVENHRAGVSSTELRSILRDGGDWRPFVPRELHDYFAEIDGPARLLGYGR